MEHSCSDHKSHRLNLKLKQIDSQQSDQPQERGGNMVEEELPVPVVNATTVSKEAKRQAKEAEEGTAFSINSIYGSDDDDDDGKTLILSLDSDDGSIISEEAEKEIAGKKRGNIAEEDRDTKVKKKRKDNYKKATIAGGINNDDSACSKTPATSKWTSAFREHQSNHDNSPSYVHETKSGKYSDNQRHSFKEVSRKKRPCILASRDSVLDPDFQRLLSEQASRKPPTKKVSQKPSVCVTM